MEKKIRFIALLAILIVGGDSLGMAREWSPPDPSEGSLTANCTG
jgi:hypothetical protein